ncbi:hypothetical protein PUN28_007498 [Cardiocondyla obscurior]|uniref:Uncharacterized protein n=1 Tax=Cardiocondyla obscurior TaxID=286306 RepID=A0AAW2G5A7_9HYME
MKPLAHNVMTFAFIKLLYYAAKKNVGFFPRNKPAIRDQRIQVYFCCLLKRFSTLYTTRYS